jgi:F-type H+-transporting ATPase subunit gamma
MAGSLLDIKRRMKSAQSMKKITRAFELIATSKVARAQEHMRNARPYANAITAALSELASSGENLNHPYLQVRPRRRAAVIVVTSDRGLAGAYSSSILREAEELLFRLKQDGIEPKLYVAGRKGAGYFKFRQRPVEESWSGFSDGPSYDNSRAVGEAVLEAFRDEEVDEIYIVYTQFVSLLSQKPEVRRLLPLEVHETEAVEPSGPRAEYLYEPSPEAVLDQLMPRYIQSRIFAVFLEAAAAELAARRNAMSAATENATSLIEQYTREYNQARQAGITQELMEVVGAAEAFKGTGS